jgi:signal transduction histidine kinase
LLDFSKTRLPDFKSVDVNALIVESLERISYPKNITVQYKLSNDLPEAIADPDQICQVILNVFNNAVQAMSEGGEIEILSGIYHDNVQIIVKDSGHGIPEECIEKIFDPLYSDKTSGIGLGLSIVKDIIDKHKGKIIVDSKVNIGTVFKILLPVKNTA